MVYKDGAQGKRTREYESATTGMLIEGVCQRSTSHTPADGFGKRTLESDHILG